MTLENDYDTTYNTTDKQGLAFNFLPNIEQNQGLNITLNTIPSNGIMHKKVIFGVYGCGTPIGGLETKAQIEHRITTVPTSCKTSFLLNKI
jgi:hypothetical protein